MPKNILVLGAGVYHIPLLKRLLKSGHYAVAASFLKDDPALVFASKRYATSSTDVESLSEIVVNENINGVITTASDWNTFSQAALNQKFGFVGVKPEQVEEVSEKFTFNKLLKKLHLPCVESQNVVLSETLFAHFKKRGKHIFKPLKGSGSADVFTTDNHFPQHLNTQPFLVQPFIAGNELGGQAMIEHGKVVFLALSQKHLVHGVVPFAHVVGSQKIAVFIADVEHQLNKIAAHLAFFSGTINFDIRQTATQLFIIDLSLRLSGNGLIEAINTSFGVDLFAHHIKQITEERREIVPAKSPKLAVSIVFGTATARKELVELREMLTAFLKNQPIKIEELVWDDVTETEAFVKSKNRFGHVIFTAETEAEIDGILSKTKQILGFNN